MHSYIQMNLLCINLFLWSHTLYSFYAHLTLSCILHFFRMQRNVTIVIVVGDVFTISAYYFRCVCLHRLEHSH